MQNNLHHWTNRFKRGFTLIELMVVLVIIGVLAALIVPNVLDRADDARATAAKTDVNNLMQALKLYKLDNQRFPTAEQGLQALVTKPTNGPAAGNWKPYLDKLPNLRLTLDASHWCAVHESYLDDQPDALQAALARTDHIHSRVGHPEGPQVSDPRAPEWKDALEKHLAWWDKVVALQKRTGAPLTVTSEFGPVSYMPTLPFTNQPVTSQWDVNVYMMQLLRKRYE